MATLEAAGTLAAADTMGITAMGIIRTTGITVTMGTHTMAMGTDTTAMGTHTMTMRTRPMDDNDAYDMQPAPSDEAPYESTSLIMSVQKELTQLGYYHGPINGVGGSETEKAVRWFQSVDHLPVTGQIDSATLQALRIT